MRSRRTLFLASILAFLALNLSGPVPLFAYHVFSVNGGAQPAAWNPSEFNADNTADTIPLSAAVPAATASPSGGVNDDVFGLLFVVDRTVAGVGTNCDSVDVYSNNGVHPFAGTFNGMTSIDSAANPALSESTVRLQFVCSTTDYNTNVVTGGTDPSILVYDGGASLNASGYNLVVYDDTANLDGILGEIFGTGAFDVTSLLGVGLPIDGSGNLALDSSATNPIVRAVFFINMAAGTPVDAGNLPGTVTHEIGHTLGLAHSGSILNASNSVTCSDALSFNSGQAGSTSRIPTMFFSLIEPDDSATLEIDDISALVRSYPEAGATAAFGAISGQVRNTAGEVLTGASVIAYDSAGDEVGVFVGGTPGLSSSLDYRIDFVPPGTYHVVLVSMDGTCSAGFVNPGDVVDGIFPTTAFSFQNRYYDGSFDESTAQAVTVTAGMETTGVDFLNVLTGSTGGGSGGGPRNFVSLTNGDSGGCSAAAGSSAGSLFHLFTFLAPFLYLLRQRSLRGRR